MREEDIVGNVHIHNEFGRISLYTTTCRSHIKHQYVIINYSLEYVEISHSRTYTNYAITIIIYKE